jgi:hypothetical protein
MLSAYTARVRRAGAAASRPNSAIACVLVFGALLCASQPAAAQFTQQGSKLVGTPTNSSSQGSSVALSADGNTAIVGGDYDNYGYGGPMGAAWVYTRSGGVWAQQAKLSDANSFAAFQGASVGLSSDGNTGNGSFFAAAVVPRAGGNLQLQTAQRFGLHALG